MALPGRIPGWRCGCAKTEEACLRSGIRIDSKRSVVFPRDMQPAGKTLVFGSPVPSALPAAPFIAGGLPCFPLFAAPPIQGQFFLPPFLGRDYSKLPIFFIYGPQKPRRADGARLPRGLGWPATPAA